MSMDIKTQQNTPYLKSFIKIVFLSVKLHSGAFEEDWHHFLISIINKNRIKLHE